ncbi:MAG: hypothetical protein ACD_10C00626G0002 [uncultured bacterium]|nr:MAG: hypothetical protein ACD_10C00626G0002 [uncultured bacterium]
MYQTLLQRSDRAFMNQGEGVVVVVSAAGHECRPGVRLGFLQHGVEQLDQCAFEANGKLDVRGIVKQSCGLREAMGRILGDHVRCSQIELLLAAEMVGNGRQRGFGRLGQSARGCPLVANGGDNVNRRFNQLRSGLGTARLVAAG